MSRHLSVAIVILALLVGSAAQAAIYVSSAPDGSAFYTDAPAKPDFQPLPGFGLPPTADVVRGQYADLVNRFAAESGVDPGLVRAVIRAESNFEPLAVSRKGAQGLMQLMPGTAGRFAVGNPFDPAENIRGGVRYLRTLMDLFPGQVSLAVAAYNAGENAVLRYGGIPPYPETRDYVNRVLRYLKDEPRAPAAVLTAAAATSPPPPAPRAAIFKSVDADGTPRYSNVPPLVRSAAR